MAKKRFGEAFEDQVAKVSSKQKHFKHESDSSSWGESLIYGFTGGGGSPETSLWRKYLFLIIIIFALSGLFLRLFSLQIVQGKDFRERADANRVQIKIIHAPRGVIYDRNGRILAQNEPGFRLVDKINPKNTKVISRDETLQLEVKNDPKVQNLEIDNLRSYPLGEKAAHIIGYISEITEEELKETNYKDYSLGDRIGRGGIEQVYEKVLRGVDGGEVIEVDAQGKPVRKLGQTDPIPGQNIYLTIDYDLQSESYNQLAQGIQKAEACCGALIASDPSSGQILALVSYPSYNPLKINDSLSNPNSPFLNRVIAGTYPPGSVFKISSALAGLSSGKITPKTIYEDTGVMNLGTFSFANWYFTQYGRKEGPVDIYKALQRSNDIYFYQLGQLVGEKTLGETAKKLGLGEKLGIDLPGEVTGLIPDDAWKQKNIGDVWYPGDTLHMAIGQGFVLTTPLQLNNLVSAIATEGVQYPPHLALKITSPAGSKIKEYKYDGSKPTFSQEQINVVKKGLELVPVAGGTAWPFFTFPIQTAGKTGTAEFGDPDKTHAWYSSYAPIKDPQIALTVLVEAGGEGSSTTGPISKEVYRWYFSPDKKNLIKDLGPVVATESARTLGE